MEIDRAAARSRPPPSFLVYRKKLQALKIKSGHPADKTARILILDECQPYSDVTAAGPWTSQMLRDFIEAHVTMVNLNEKLHRSLHPNVRASEAGCLDNHAVVQISQRGIFEPTHQKSSAEGIRL